MKRPGSPRSEQKPATSTLKFCDTKNAGTFVSYLDDFVADLFYNDKSVFLAG